jgi:hypothetical protein
MNNRIIRNMLIHPQTKSEKDKTERALRAQVRSLWKRPCRTFRGDRAGAAAFRSNVQIATEEMLSSRFFPRDPAASGAGYRCWVDGKDGGEVRVFLRTYNERRSTWEVSPASLDEVARKIIHNAEARVRSRP